MVEAAAVLSGATITTISLAVIMSEPKVTLTYIIPVMLGVLVAKTVADALVSRGIHDLVIQLSQLPYLESKHKYIWGTLSVADVAESHVATIRPDESNMLERLRGELANVLAPGYHDSSFPIVQLEHHGGGCRMVGYIGVNELERVLSIQSRSATSTRSRCTNSRRHTRTAWRLAKAFTSRLAGGRPVRFQRVHGSAPLKVQTGSPLKLVQQLFMKPGARYVVVTDPDGLYEGSTDKKVWLAFLSSLGDH